MVCNNELADNSMTFLKGLEFSFMGKSTSCGVINIWQRLQTMDRSNKSIIDEPAAENTTVGYEDLEVHAGCLFCEQSDELSKKTAWLPYSICP